MINQLKILLSFDRYIWILFVLYFGISTFAITLFNISDAPNITTSTNITSLFYMMVLPIYIFVKSIYRYIRELNLWIGFGLTRKQFFTTNLLYNILWSAFFALTIPVTLSAEKNFFGLLFTNYIETIEIGSYDIPMFIYYLSELIIFQAIVSIFYFLKSHTFFLIIFIIFGVISLNFLINFFGTNLFELAYLPIYIIIALILNYFTLLRSDIRG